MKRPIRMRTITIVSSEDSRIDSKNMTKFVFVDGSPKRQRTSKLLVIPQLKRNTKSLTNVAD
jgi:hypothetical protein